MCFVLCTGKNHHETGHLVYLKKENFVNFVILDMSKKLWPAQHVNESLSLSLQKQICLKLAIWE